MKCYENEMFRPEIGSKLMLVAYFYAYNQNTNHTRHSKLLSKDDEQCYSLFYFIFKIILIEHILNAQTWFHHIITTVMIHIILVIQHRNL